MKNLAIGFAVAAAFVGAAFGQSATEADWAAAKLATTLTVERAEHPGQYQIDATISDLVTSKVLSKPKLITVAGKPATIEVGSAGTQTLKMVVTVSPDGKTASYTSEFRRLGKVETTQSTTLAVGVRG